MHEASAFAGLDTLDREKSKTLHALACGEVWTMSRMASGQAGMGPNGNSGTAYFLGVDCDEPLACRVHLERPGSQLIVFEPEEAGVRVLHEAKASTA